MWQALSVSAFEKVFDFEARILKNAEKQSFGQILPTMDRDNYGFSHWMFQNQMGASLAAFGVSVAEKKTEKFASTRHYSIATETVSV
jgi:hypothetical protein